MNIVAIVQARLGSSRLPGKVMKKICKKTVLEHVYERLKLSKYLNDIVIATTDKDEDKKIIGLCEELGINYFIGSEDDVLSRYYNCAKKYNVDTVVRITSDCPLIDSKVLDEMLSFYINNKYDLVTNAGAEIYRTYPRGLDIEIFSFNLLKTAYLNANQNYEKEHVTPYIYENGFNIHYYKNNKDYSKYRLTLDTKEDFELINKIYCELYNDNHNFFLEDIIKVLENNPKLELINKYIKQKNIKQ
ncbi:cytidylyltransferase family protein [[Clostridium] bifermentans ATCC 638]|uniref:Cytidylyltransferase family protein n=1 Tax=Paraclostridium bifermentans ATCC 638 = DSM 14991 TaxID=1233171 RepID=T4VNR7_PARBF|nr:glycosyltransferase family protein [Paraclostridium bifermentans]EQK42307.1 cytidylyltransferase family protein [[Clostridium] bifermentans ATCC 638] [Paraclostridium bifermentans ATCC 638 = DSM 14991]RIZ59840.1 acylneuraminate cytidylyltransferase [Paraclostridium bifermentans]UAG19159.1 glycosyltransferase family protein [Paraclostridium bifermentans]